jgi:hypothetical protein
MEVVHVDIIRLEDTGMPVDTVYLYTHLAKQFNEEVHIQDIRDVFYGNFFCGEQYGTDDLQGFVLRTLRGNFSLQPFATVDFK